MITAKGFLYNQQFTKAQLYARDAFFKVIDARIAGDESSGPERSGTPFILSRLEDSSSVIASMMERREYGICRYNGSLVTASDRLHEVVTVILNEDEKADFLSVFNTLTSASVQDSMDETALRTAIFRYCGASPRTIDGAVHEGEIGKSNPEEADAAHHYGKSVAEFQLLLKGLRNALSEENPLKNYETTYLPARDVLKAIQAGIIMADMPDGERDTLHKTLTKKVRETMPEGSIFRMKDQNSGQAAAMAMRIATMAITDLQQHIRGTAIETLLHGRPIHLAQRGGGKIVEGLSMSPIDKDKGGIESLVFFVRRIKKGYQSLN